jgi:SDR family mycofactocin-dependent oxidoreductase
MPRVEGKVIFLTGAARGQGRAHAVRLAQEGADIICCDIFEDIATNWYPLSRQSDLDETVRLIESYDRRVVARQGDVRDPAAMKAIVNEGVAELGRLDGVVANAGICPIIEPDPQAFFDAVTVDFNGVVHALDAALPHIVDGGSIAATSSVAALLTRTTDTSGPGGIGYALAKRFVASLVNDLALVLAPRKIRVNAVHPTNCNTDMLNSDIMYQAFRPDLQNPTREDALKAFPTMTAMGNPYVEPEDIANMVLFLMSDESRYVSGMQMRVDAGSIVRHRPQQPTF